MLNPRHMKLKAFYTLAELARATESNPRKVERLLKNADIVCRKMGRQRIVFVSHLEERLPELWASMVACERARAVSRSLAGLALRPR